MKFKVKCLQKQDSTDLLHYGLWSEAMPSVCLCLWFFLLKNKRCEFSPIAM